MSWGSRLAEPTLSPASSDVISVDTMPECISVTDRAVESAGGGPFCLSDIRSAPSLLESVDAVNIRGSRHLHGGLEQVDLHLPFSVPLLQGPATGLPHASQLQGEGPPPGSLLAGSIMFSELLGWCPQPLMLGNACLFDLIVARLQRSLHLHAWGFSGPFTLRPSKDCLLQKALILVALATGFWSSQRKVFTRFDHWTSFVQGDSVVSLAPSPTSLVKNDLKNYRFQPVAVPAWKVKGEHYRICPVGTLRQFLSTTAD
ncbi:hypothetical protein Hamer_G026006 [Homarus americanus]|uniref:Uncharacterized protein n=1 Tax=Homarus americanus TaxID=6706 RepID=A0A8J5K852_HOMAM|nr:hypothetical protein Hamer_G026006 [Homarus americanus]